MRQRGPMIRHDPVRGPFGYPRATGRQAVAVHEVDPPCSTLTLLPGSRRIHGTLAISGLRLFQTPTGQTQRPGSGSGGLPELDPASLEMQAGLPGGVDAPVLSDRTRRPTFDALPEVDPAAAAPPPRSRGCIVGRHSQDRM